MWGQEAEESATVTVVILAYGEEPWLVESVTSALAAQAVTEVIVVDNGAAEAVAAVRAHQAVANDPRVLVLRPPNNLGYAGGCNLGARHATADVLVFLNSDAYLEPEATYHLLNALEPPSVGLVTSQLRLADRPDTVNSVGNPVQFLAFSWAGHYGESATEHAEPGAVASVSGACFAVRRDSWRRIGGFDSRYFAYGEDLDLSLRAWQQGLSVAYEPRAVAYHHYDQRRNPDKRALLERNRWISVTTLYERRTLALVLPMMVAVDAGVTLTAIRQGWFPAKASTWRYLIGHRREVGARRRAIQARRTVPDAQLYPLIRGTVDPPPGMDVFVPDVANRVLAAYWGWVGRRIGAADSSYSAPPAAAGAVGSPPPAVRS